MRFVLLLTLSLVLVTPITAAAQAVGCDKTHTSEKKKKTCHWTLTKGKVCPETASSKLSK